MASRLKIKRLDGLLLAIFYAAAGIAEIAIFASSNFLPVAGALAILSFIAAYGLLLAKKWSVWLAIGLFFPQIVFGLTSLNTGIILYALLPEVNVLLLDIGLTVFVILFLASFVYMAAKRKTFE